MGINDDSLINDTVGPKPCAECDRLKLQNQDLQKEVERLRGPFTCKHPPEHAGGACAACHAEWIERAQVAERLLREERERCAKIASEEPKNCQNATDDYSKGYLDGSLATGGAIRRRILYETRKRAIGRTNLEQYLATSMQMVMAREDGRDENSYLDKLDEIYERLTQDEKDFCSEMGDDWGRHHKGRGCQKCFSRPLPEKCDSSNPCRT